MNDLIKFARIRDNLKREREVITKRIEQIDAALNGQIPNGLDNMPIKRKRAMRKTKLIKGKVKRKYTRRKKVETPASSPAPEMTADPKNVAP